ncbi:MAG: hypothetical protein FWC13_02760 [Oscillospiraceae bacterium]|nr:hypothetical protein [Oscillospiraceae bacterium]
MTKLKAEAVEIIQDLPDEKVAMALEFLTKLQAMYETKEPLNMSKLTKDELDIEIEKGLADIRAGRVIPAEEVWKKHLSWDNA